jgi:hypothetical protein
MKKPIIILFFISLYWSSLFAQNGNVSILEFTNSNDSSSINVIQYLDDSRAHYNFLNEEENALKQYQNITYDASRNAFVGQSEGQHMSVLPGLVWTLKVNSSNHHKNPKLNISSINTNNPSEMLSYSETLEYIALQKKNNIAVIMPGLLAYTLIDSSNCLRTISYKYIQPIPNITIVDEFTFSEKLGLRSFKDKAGVEFLLSRINDVKVSEVIKNLCR